MLSRSNSIAGDRLRRAKSTSSAHTSASGHQRLSTSIDPFVSHRDAEAAAVEAFSRARRTDEMAAQSSRPKPNRRRSQKMGGKSEGSHFEDARKKALAQTGERAHTLTAMQSKQSPVGKASTNSDEETVVTRKRSIIPPAPNVGKSTASQPSLAPPLRKRTSGYTDGSPAPRYSLLERRSSVLQVRPSEESAPSEGDNYTSSLAHLTAFGQSHDDDKLPLSYQTRTSIKRNSSNQDTQSTRADAPQPRRVRERKSFLGSFQKRRATDAGYIFDTGLPPFDQASLNTAASISHQPAYNVVSAAKSQQKSRNFSDTIKGRLKKVFRRVSKPQPPPRGLPPQQVEAKDFHFAVGDHDLSEASFVDYTDPFMTVAAEDPRVPPTQNQYTTTSTTSKSRVTSWTNSTINQSSVRTANGPFTIGQGPPRALHKSDSNATLRKTSSLFFGRPNRNKLRRSSKADLKSSSEESQSLYSALQRRMRTSRSTEAANEVPAATDQTSTQPSSEIGALARLPSQAQRVSSTHLLNPWRGLSAAENDQTTIRPVSTPDLPPVPEATHDNLSATSSPDRTVLHHVQTSSPHASSTPLRRSCAIKAPGPSKDQVARRKDVAEKRWSSTRGPFASGVMSAVDDNPYTLPSMARNVGMSVRENHTSLPHSCRADVISPSVYSRATDGASPRPETPMDMDAMLDSEAGATKITVTGREVRRYEISPEKRRGAGGGSQEWRDWIASELSDFAHGLREDEYDGEELADGTGPGRGSRPASAASGRYMNDRYPAFYNPPADTSRSRASSRQSNASSRHMQGEDVAPEDGMFKSMRRLTKSRTASIESELRLTTASINAGAGSSASAMLAGGTAARQRRISKPRSFAEIEAEARLDATVDTAAGNASIPPSSVPAISATQPTVTSRPKSNYDLRANWKATASAQAKALQVKRIEHSTSVDQLRRLPHLATGSEAEVPPAEPTSDSNVPNSCNLAQRKPRSPVDVDTTLLRISAGPYADTKSPSAEKKSPPFRGHSHTFNPNQENARPPSAAKLNVELGETKRGGPPQNPFELEANVVRYSSTKEQAYDDHDSTRTTRTSATGLPALSSSEWLAAGSSSGAPLSKHQARVGSNMRRKEMVGAAFDKSRLNQSQPTSAAVGGSKVGENIGSGEGSRTSPGQRLVSSWLKEEGREGSHRERERTVTPRFV